MGRRREEEDPDRFLQLRGGRFHYRRRVPKEMRGLDGRGHIIRHALGTDNLTKARAARDLYEAADNAFWSSLLLGDNADAARSRYKLAAKRAESLGFVYRPMAEILAREPLDTILQRVEATIDLPAESPIVSSLGGMEERPDDTVSEALKLYLDVICRDLIRKKSPDQKKRWKAKREHSAQVFIELAGDKAMGAITREDALKMHQHYLDMIAPKKGAPTHSASTGNRNLGNMRKFYDGYFRYLGFPEQKNPFAMLSFSDKAGRTRPSFSTAWIRERILNPGALAALNTDARAIFLAMIETGARPSELANLTEDAIALDAPVPHLIIAPRDDPDDPREIKTGSSVRKIPLVGVSLAVFRKHRKGFPRYKDNSSSWSATVNKHLDRHGLLPTPKHSAYSLRHSFEDRMKNGRLDEELRRMLMGHTIDRPKYGEGGEMEMWRDELLKIALPFDQQIV